MIRRVLGKLQPVLYRGIKWYYSKPRTINKRGIKIHLLPTVFHPSLYLSTDIFLDFMLNQDIDNKKILELGTGNGFISLYLAKHKNCQVTCSDINKNALIGLRKSAQLNELKLTTIKSNLFDNIPTQHFDYILINPPYYPKPISSTDEFAFYCGENFEYFLKLNEQIIPYLQNGTQVFMILSETAALTEITALSEKKGIQMKTIHQQNKLKELFYIYKLVN